MSGAHRERSWLRGRAAALAGKAATVCRTAPGTIYRDDWLEGHGEGLRALEKMSAAEMTKHLSPAEKHALMNYPLQLAPYDVLPTGIRQTLFARGLLKQFEGLGWGKIPFMTITDRGEDVRAVLRKTLL